MINNLAILDIHPDRSFIKALLSQGLSIYLMEWHADPIKNRHRAMADYILGDIDQAMNHICIQEKISKLHVMGVCQGGYFSLCLNAIKPDRFASVIPVVTPVDFHAAGCKLYNPSHQTYLASFLVSLKQAPFISGKAIGACIQAIDPLYIVQNKYDAWQACGESIEKQLLFYAIESWSQDYPDQPTQIAIDFFQEAIMNNALIHHQLYLHHQPVELANIKNPILNIYAKKDYFWSELTPSALTNHHRSQHYESYAYDGGHIGIFVGETALKTIPQRIAQFMQKVSQMMVVSSVV